MVDKIWIKDVRNLDELVLDFTDQKPLFISGDNNQGKTSLLEAIYLACQGVSPLQATTDTFIRQGAKECALGVDVRQNQEKKRIYTKIQRSGARRITIDETPTTRVMQLQKLAPVLFLSSDVIHVFQESADFRRRVLDQFCSLYDAEYGALHKRLMRALKQKNKLLKTTQDPDAIALWNDQLVELAWPIIQTRRALCQVLTETALPLIAYVKPEFAENVSIDYDVCRLASQGDYTEMLRAQYKEDFQKECYLGYSLSGPQRDDFKLMIDGKKVQDFYSRGINRMMAILFTFAKSKALEAVLGQRPMILLDDTCAEIDTGHKKKLFQVAQDFSQVVYTTILDEDAALFDTKKISRIQDGVLTYA